MTKPMLILMAGTTGVGKTTIIDSVVKKYPDLFSRPRSVTTRPPRQLEGNEEYRFISKSTFDELYSAGQLLTKDYVYGNYYGIHRDSVEEIVARGMFAIKEVHPSNHNRVRQGYPHCLSVLVKRNLPNLDDLCAERRDRVAEDLLFYSQISEDDFDVILDLDVLVDSAPSYLARSVLAIEEHFQLLPRPGEIDRLNRQGYASVLPEFSDEERPTTRNFHEISRRFWMHVQARIVKAERCLEIGPGRGWLRSVLQPPEPNRFQFCDLIGSSSSGVTAASARQLPYANSSFDYVIASLADGFLYPAALVEIGRVLKPGGAFIFSTPAGEWARALREPPEVHFTRFKLRSGLDAKVYSLCHTANFLEKILKSAGFEEIDIRSFGVSELSEGESVSTAISRVTAQFGTECPILHCSIAQKEW